MKEQTFQIKYNTKSTDDSDRWILICDGEEILVSNIVINSKTITSKDFIKELDEYKYHISCIGYLSISNNVAYIEKKDNSLKRHLLKTISYRLVATATTISVAYCLGFPLEISALLGIGEVALKPIIYFIHERVWYSIKID